MRNSIFDIEIRIDISKEFEKMYRYLHCKNNTTFDPSGISKTFISALDSYAFKYWPYRGTALNCSEYLELFGLYTNMRYENFDIDVKKFLYYIEFIYNIYKYASYNNTIQIYDEDVKAILNNIDLIIEKMDYKFIQNSDRYILVKRDADVDSVIELVDDDIALLLLEYNDFKIIDNLKRKNEILKYIDKYIEKNQSYFSKLDKDTYSSIGFIMNKFGINHKIDDKYKNLTDIELLKWYDKCYKLCLHLIRKQEIKKINDERKSLESK